MENKYTRRDIGKIGLLSVLGVGLSGKAMAAASTTYYIDAADGDNGNSGTSIDEPLADFTTLARGGRNVVSPGDVVKIRGEAQKGAVEVEGTVFMGGISGTADRPIVIESYGDEWAAVDFSNNSNHGFNLPNAKHIIFRNFEVRHADKHNFRISDTGRGSYGIGFYGLDIHGHGAGGRFGAGISIRLGAHSCHIENCYVHHSGSLSDNSDGVIISNGAHSCTVVDCEFYLNADDGLDLFLSDPNRPHTVKRCIARRNGYDSNGNRAGDGNGFKLGSGNGPSGGHRLQRCIAYDNANRGFNSNGANTPLTVYHCIAYANGGVAFRTDGVAHKLRNCIAADNGGGLGDATAADDVSNSWNLDISNPQFVSTDPSTDSCFSLQSGSPCINAGVDVGLAYSGTSPDLGAYEYDSSPDSTQENLLVIESAGSEKSEYQVTVSGELRKTAGGDASINPQDTINGSTASGFVWGGTDAYYFTGTITDISMTGDATALVNGEPIDVSQTNTLTIRGTGSYASYSFSVSGDLNGESLSGEDDITGSSATGAVGPGEDRYTFTGELSDLNVKGDATVLVNGKEVTTDRSHTLVIRGSGSYASYSFSVSGDLNGEGLSGEDDITGSSAIGAVGPGEDRYTFTGELSDLRVRGDATVLVDGKVIDTSQQTTLVIRGSGSYASYSFTVSGDLSGNGLSGEDDITGSSATGAVGPGEDRYVFTGEITDIVIEGEATVLVDGKAVDPAQL